MKILPLLAATVSLLALLGHPAGAADAKKVMSPAVIEQYALADRLIAYGVERKDPLIILAAVKLRGSLVEESPALPKVPLTNDEALAAAGELARGAEDILGLIEDVKAEGSRGDYYTTGGSYCYTVGSATICN